MDRQSAAGIAYKRTEIGSYRFIVLPGILNVLVALPGPLNVAVQVSPLDPDEENVKCTVSPSFVQNADLV
ncbi:hypothetical protein FRC12_021880 [Ceratobasidium sp. 428]|nr:hypothetical protein FRC12_021880 [Ceratobasidium sp. 428]